jgi:hypothetical protein
MFAYSLLYWLSGFFSLLAQKKEIFYLPLICALVIFSAPHMGPDFYSYTEIYGSLPPPSYLIGNIEVLKEFHGEPLFLIIGSIFSIFTTKYIYYQFFIITLIIIIRVNFLRNLSPYFYIAICWYISAFLYYDITAIRAGLASSIALFGLILYSKKQYIYYGLIVIVASLFHTAAISAFLLPLAHLIVRKKYVFFSTVSLIIIVGFFGIGKLASSLIGFLDLDFKIATNITDYSTGYLATSAAGIMRGTVFKSLILLLIFYWKGSRFLSENTNNCIVSGYLIGFFFLIAMNDVPIISDRIFNFWGILECIMVAAIPCYFKSYNRCYVVSLLLFLGFMQLFWNYENLYQIYETALFNNA